MASKTPFETDSLRVVYDDHPQRVQMTQSDEVLSSRNVDKQDVISVALRLTAPTHARRRGHVEYKPVDGRYSSLNAC